MYKKIILYSAMVFALSALQISFVGGLPARLSNLSLVLVALAYSFGLSRKAFAWSLAFGAGLAFDLILFTPLGLYTAGFFLSALVISLLHGNLLTNQSLYTYIALTFAATATHRAWEYLYYSAGCFFLDQESYLVLNKEFWLNQAAALILNGALSALSFYILAYLSKRLAPVFLMPKNK